jgi:glycosyltransferase involved in cell wall biosynthesis
MRTPPFQPSATKPRLMVVSPFIDKSHGTERVVAEQIERLSSEYEIHLYSERVEDLDLRTIVWHRVYIPPGPHLFRYIWWFVANHVYRRWKTERDGLGPETVYSPGINCLDADVICAHIVFGEFRQQVRGELRLGCNPMKTWPLLLHRRLYYRLIEFLENRVYKNEKLELAAVSEKTAGAIARFCGRKRSVDVIYNGIDAAQFSENRLRALRPAARAELGLAEGDVAVLLVGNDWKKKGLQYLLAAASSLRNPRLRILVVGNDTTTPYQGMIQESGLGGQISFLPLRSEVEYYYAAADIYAGPSLDDSFALPPAEAMACGLPVITTRNNGGCAIMHHGEDGLILEDPTDVQTLSRWLAQLAENPAYRRQLGGAAARTASQYTWERNVEQMRTLFERAQKSRKLAVGQWRTIPPRLEKS